MKKLCLLLLLCLLPAAALGEGLIISEACNNNDLLWQLDFCDYVELYNAGDTEVELSAYALSRDEEDLLDCILPHRTVAPGEYALLLCDGSDLSFNLPKGGCTLYLTPKNEGEPCDTAEIPAMEDAYWTHDRGVVSYPSPGNENTIEGWDLFRAGYAQSLVINEVVSSNGSLLEKDGESYDLIELTNVSLAEINLGDFFLSDKKKELQRAPLPEKTLAPGETIVLFASGGEAEDELPFKVSAEGETLYVTNADGKCIDALHVPQLDRDTSYGRQDGSLAYFEDPTIGKPNEGGLVLQMDTPEASAATGFYASAFQVTFLGEGEIRYTLDGCDPRGKRGIVWDGTPIDITQSTVVRVCAVGENAKDSSVAAYHYLFDCEKYELPVLSLSADPGNGILGDNGLWENHEKRGVEVETHAVYLENGEVKFSLFCGTRLHGQGSRQLGKKSMQLRFRGRYGQSTLDYPIFEDIDFTAYDALVLRCGSEDYRRAFLRDEFMTSLIAETMPDVMIQAHKPVNLFIDGEYYGIYYIREKLNDTYVSYHLGGEAENADMVNGWSAAEHGSSDDFRALLDFCRNRDLSKQENFDEVAAQLSLDSFMDYYIARAYTGDRDYPNIRHVRAEGGKWHIVNFDLDWGFGNDPARFGSYIGNVKDTRAQNTVIINALVKNPTFRQQMIERIAYHFEHTFDPDRVIAHLNEMVAVLRHDMAYDRDRWGLTMELWDEHLEFLREFARGRLTDLTDSAKIAFRMSDEEMQQYFSKWMEE